MPDPVPTTRSDDRSLVRVIGDYLSRTSPRFLMVVGSVGAGKSSFLKALVEEVTGPRLMLLYTQPMVPSSAGTSRAQVGGATTLLFGELPMRPGDSGRPAVATRSAGTRPPESAANPTPDALQHALGHMLAHGGGTIVVDSWDRASETSLREMVADPATVGTFAYPATDFAALESTLIGMQMNLALGIIPEIAAPLQSIADMLVELKVEEHAGVRVRVMTVSKVRGASLDTHDQLYSLEGGRFRALPDFPAGFHVPATEPDPDPAPATESIWPGSSAFANAFGRLAYGGLSALTLSPECSDALAASVAAPLVAHVLKAGGRVVWMPAPSQRPSAVIAPLRERLPAEWVRERLRILSPIAEDAGLGELASVVLPLRRELGEGRDLRQATAPGVGPIFPDAHRFLRLAPGQGPSLYVMSIEGLKASTTTAGITLNAVTLPAVLAAYARLPRFHGFGYGRADDPVSAALLPMVGTLLSMNVVCGRPVIQGAKPRTPTYILDWTSPSGRLELIPSG